MKKMIPAYLLQIAMLVTVLFVGLRLLHEVRTLRSDLIKMSSPSGQRPTRDEPALRVKIQ